MTGFGPAPNLKMSAFADRTRAVAAELYPNNTLLLVQSTPDGKRSGCSAPPIELETRKGNGHGED